MCIRDSYLINNGNNSQAAGKEWRDVSFKQDNISFGGGIAIGRQWLIKNKFSIDSIYAVALQVSLNANQMVYERGKEAAIEQLARDIIWDYIEVYTPDAIPLALEYVILLWGSEHLIPFDEVMNMRLRAIRLAKLIGYREKQSEINNERLFSSGTIETLEENNPDH